VALLLLLLHEAALRLELLVAQEGHLGRRLAAAAVADEPVVFVFGLRV